MIEELGASGQMPQPVDISSSQGSSQRENRLLPLSPSSPVLIGLWRDDCGVERSREGPRSQPNPRPIQKHISHSSPGGDGY